MKQFYLIGSLISAAMIGGGIAGKTILDSRKKKLLEKQFKERLASGKNLKYSDLNRVLKSTTFSENIIVPDSSLQLYKTIVKHGIVFEIRIIPKASRLEKDLHNCIAFCRSSFLEDYCKDPVQIFIREEALLATQATIDFLINHEIGHILVPSNNGTEYFQLSDSILGNYNLQLALRNVRKFLREYDLEDCKIIEDLNKNEFKLHMKLTEIDKMYLENSADLYALLEDPKATIPYLESSIEDIDSQVEGIKNPVYRFFTKMYYVRLYNKMIRIANNIIA